MSHTIRRTKWKEKDPMKIDMRREIERIELEEALNEAENYYDEDDDPYQLTSHQMMEDSHYQD